MAKEKQKPAGSLARFQVLAIISALLGILICAALLYLQVVQGANNKHNDASARQQAKAIAALIDSRYNDMRATLAQQASSSVVVNAMGNRSEAAKAERVAAAARVASSIPMALRVDLIPSGDAKVDLAASVPINFAALDLIRRAESAEFVGPEASANPRDVIYTAAPVTDADGVSGVLFVAYSANYLQSALAGFDQTLGLAQVEQVIDKAPPAVVLEYGNGSAALVGVRQPLKAPSWTLVFSGAETGSITSLLDLALPIAAVLALALGGIWLAFNKLNAAVKSDADALAEFGNKLLNGRIGASDHFQISYFQKLARALADALGESGGTPAARNASKAQNRGAAKAAALQSDDEALDDDLLDDAADDETRAAAKASAKAAALLTGDAEESSGDDFLDLGDDDFDMSADQSATGSFLQTNLPDVEEDLGDSDSNADGNFGIGDTLGEEETSPSAPNIDFDAGIFRAYDIRGIVDTNLTPDVVYWIGRAFAAEALSKNQSRTAVGRDGRLSSPALSEQLIRGLLHGGMDVTDIGQVATPMLYFATHNLNTGTGVMITGSHNPPEYNGLKMMIGGETLAEERITALHQRLVDNELPAPSAEGELSAVVINTDYMDRILDDVAVAQSLKVVVDCGNGVAGGIAPLVLQELGCDVIPLYCEVDGTFPNHHPDPADPRNMMDLITVVKAESADLGIAFDGDGDRIGVVTNTGKIIWPDKLMMLFARDIVGRNPGADIIYDVKCSRHLNNLISEYGGRPIMWKTGHSHIKAKLKETGALLAGEFSGHVAFGERWYGFDDAIYTAARLLEIVGGGTETVADLFDEFPATQSTPEIQIETTESAKFQIIKKLASTGDFGDGTLTSIDGVRVDYANGWGLVRASNTSPKLTLRFEADTNEALDEVQDRFRTELAKVHSSLKF